MTGTAWKVEKWIFSKKDFSVENVFGRFRKLCSSGVLRGHHDWRAIGTASVMLVLA